MTYEYRRFWITSSDGVEREWLLAEAFEAGAAGAQEIDEAGRYRASIYATSERVASIHVLLRRLSTEATEVGPVEGMPDTDWSQAWREGLEAISISKRLLIRPPFIDVELEQGQREIVIDPGQAFGIGGHASTRLCLEWIDALVPSRTRIGRLEPIAVLDVGTGSGVLALAAVALGAGRAVGFDLDPIATRAAREAALTNGLAHVAHFVTGPIEALRLASAGCSLVLANLLKQEMMPIATQIAGCVSRNGRLVLAGLLFEDVLEVEERFGREGLVEIGRRSREDSTGEWIGLCLAFEE